MSLIKYNKFTEYNKIFENVQKAKKILRDKGIDPNTSEKFQNIRKMLGNNTGYVGKFTQWHFEDNESMAKLEEIYKMLLTTKLDKPIDEFKTLENLYDYIQETDVYKKVKHMLGGLPSGIRNRVKDNKQLINLLKTNSNHYKILREHFEKVGFRYSDKSNEKFIEDTKVFIKNLTGDFNLENMLKISEKYDVDVILSKPELLVLKINTFEAAESELGSTQWCISTSKNQWDYYVSLADIQYFIYDFTKDVTDIKHKIGVTVSMDGRWKAVHWNDDTQPRSFDEVYQLFDEAE